MIDLRKNEIVIVEGLKDYLSTDLRPCEVVRQNQVAKAPPYPFVSYTVTAPVLEKQGTYCEAEDGSLYMDATQNWSFTVQSDDADEAMALALRVFAYFTAVGLTALADKNITVRRVSGVTTRDNLLTIQYEHRNGLDVTFGVPYTINPDELGGSGVIETYGLSNSTSVLGEAVLDTMTLS